MSTHVSDPPTSPVSVPEPPVIADDGLAEYDDWIAEGKPGYIPDQHVSKGVVDPVVAVDPVPAIDPSWITHDWSGVAQCESGGNWQTNTGNGFYGGLQFEQSTWEYFQGTQFAARADLATQQQQELVAERVFNEQGVDAWPVCGQFLRDAAPVPALASGTDLTAPCPDHIAFMEGGLRETTIRLARAVCAIFGDELQTIGGWRADGMGAPDHPEGRALDIMIPNYNSDNSLGYRINDWIQAHAAEYDVQYSIWWGTYYPVGGDPSSYSGCCDDDSMHHSHVHVSVN